MSADAEFAKQAVERLLKPALQAVQKGAITELVRLASEPTTAAGREAIANFSRTVQIIDQLHGILIAQTGDSAIEAFDQARRNQIAKIRPEARKILGIG